MREITISAISKSYHGTCVLNRFSAKLAAGGVYCLMGPSGVGKTTLLRILMGLEQPDAGQILPEEAVKIGAVFQEDRLLEYADAIKNIRVAAGRDRLCVQPEQVLGAMLEPDAWHRPVRELSGGMRRRVAVARALAVQAELLLMDEPFTGLDEESRSRTIQTIREYRRGRTLLLVTHQREDVSALGAELLQLPGGTAESIPFQTGHCETGSQS
jgi:NitT/TauT family transport system ATP-binding protein